MSKKLFVICMFAVIGLITATGAQATGFAVLSGLPGEVPQRL